MKAKSNKDRIQWYMKETRRSQEFRKSTLGMDDLWTRLSDMYLGKLTLDPDKDAANIGVNMAFSTINVMYPSVSAGIPNVEVRANNPAFERNAVLVEEILNYTWRHHQFQPSFRAAAKDFLMFGHGWLKVAWEYQTEEQERSEDELVDEFVELRTQVDQAAQMNPQFANELPSDDDIAGSLEQIGEVVVADNPMVSHVSVRDIFVNPEATSMKDIRWIAQRIIAPIEEVADNNAFSSERKKLQGTLNSFESNDPRSQGHDNLHHDMVEYWEFYDVAESTMSVFSHERGGTFLIKPTTMPFAFGQPFVMMRNYDVPDQFYPMGDLEQLWPLQEELNKTRSEMMNYRKAYARKYVARESAFQKGDHEKLTSRVDGEVILVANDNIPLSDVVQPVPINSLDPALFNWSQQINHDMQEVSGVSEYARGGAGAIRRTATEAALIQDALNARSSEKLTLVEMAASEVARKVLQLMQQFVTGEQVARTFGDDGATLWLPYTREAIQGEYDFHVEAGSTQPNNETFRRQNAIALMNTMGPFLGSVINPHELVLHILREGFSIRQPEKFLMQGLPPEAADQPSNPGTLPGGQGVDTPQLTPEERRDAEAQSQIEGVPPELANQLMNQNGVNPQI